MANCKRCQAALHDQGALCTDCTVNLAGRLNDIPVLLAELDTTLAKQGRGGGLSGLPSGPGSSVHPDMSVSTVSGLLRSSCLGWAHALDGYYGVAPWKHLLKHIDDVRLHDWAVYLDADLARRSAEAWQKVDRPEDRWYAGVCGTATETARGAAICSRVLWAKLTDDEIICPHCHTRWSVAERRAWLIRSAEDFEGNATMVASVVSYVTQKRVAPATVRSWSFRGLLIPKQRRTPTHYRVGDVIDCALRHEPVTA